MMLTETQTKALIQIVRDASKAEILPRFRNLSAGEIDTKSGPDDLVTIADKRAEAFMTTRIAEVLPDALIIGEEAVAEDPTLLERLKQADLAVIIDPVDGTNNFAKGLAVFGVILAVMAKGQTVFGLLYDPVVDDWIEAHCGRGVAFENANGLRRELSPPKAPASVAEAEGYVSLFMFDKVTQAQIAKGYPSFARIHSLRCSCHEYRMVAQGHASFILNAGANSWDHAAGGLVLEELGGALLDASGARYDPVRSAAPLWGFPFADPNLQRQIRAALL